ncbi:thiolase family protein [Pantoea sp. A4]|uniref:thiolase family protein n=1 Tax=Pantoea sp. A4 TaxID=1225184 RepID=UPI00035FDDEA|nr:thiolase family protein [Pantoea sp. A4]
MNRDNFQPAEDNQPVIVAAYRTPVGRAYGALSSLSLSELLAPLFGKISADARFCADQVDEVIIGNATGGGGNIARLAALSAGLPLSIPAVTIDRQCGAGLEAVMQACRLIQAQAGDCYLAGGVESVSTAPWRVEKPATAKQLPRFFSRAQFSPEEIGDPEMGVAAENVASKYGISRERQDAFALRSHQRAVAAQQKGLFNAELVPLRAGEQWVNQDECPRPATSLEKLAALPAAFVAQGSVTAGNCCPLNDGAALVLIMSRRKAREAGFSSGLQFVDGCSAGVDPHYLGIGPVPATQKLMQRQQMADLSDVGLIEFNEAFASQVLASLDLLGVDEQRVNQQGGAIALGHPYGASGAILVTRLFHQRAASGENSDYALAMLGIAGGLGLSALFKHVELSPTA